MSVLRGKSQRRIVPRWRTSSSTGNSQELGALKTAPVTPLSGSEHVREANVAFTKSPSIGTAADVISALPIPGEDSRVAEALAFVINHEALAPKSLAALAKSIQSGESEVGRVTSVAKLRHLARLNSNNPLVWSDLARHFASIGDRQRADRCMRTAVKLAPNHRWILRTAARFFVHSGDPVAAHVLLAKHPYTSSDPWLLAAELATAQVAQRPPKFWRHAVDHIKWEKSSPANTSELATAIAMFELEDGKARRARRLVESALRAPTENTLAQVSWARQNKHLNDVNEISALARKNEHAFEARYGILLGAGSILQARDEGKSWANDEPFATRPLVGLAFIAAMLDDHDETIRLTNDIRRIDNHIDHTLEMNVVFSRLSSGKFTYDADKSLLELIRAQLMELVLNKGDNHALANLALWQYRYGDAQEGRRLYEQAILNLEKTSSTESAALAATFATREAILAKQDVATSLLSKASVLAERSRSESVKFYLRKLDALSKAPTESEKLLSPIGAKDFIKQK